MLALAATKAGREQHALAGLHSPSTVRPLPSLPRRCRCRECAAAFSLSACPGESRDRDDSARRLSPAPELRWLWESGTGTSSSFRTSGPPYSWILTAFIVSVHHSESWTEIRQRGCSDFFFLNGLSLLQNPLLVAVRIAACCCSGFRWRRRLSSFLLGSTIVSFTVSCCASIGGGTRMRGGST